MFHPVPVYATRRRGFSLVLSLTVMAMLLLLCISVAALMSVEMRVARAAVSQSRARLNAMVGARIALGEIQRTLGPDQRVSATAEILCDPKGVRPTDGGYYNNLKGDLVTHPRWVGVWNSGPVDDGQTLPDAAASDEQYKVVQRTQGGYLMDSRFASGRDWANDRANKTPASATKRLTGWLVSGNEALPPDAARALTPFTPFDPTRDTTLAGPGTLGANPFAEGDKSDGRGARARRVAISDAVGNAHGDYAYWVADEGVKARFNLRDRFEAITPSAKNLADGGMFRLMLPQRNDFTAVENPVDTAHAVNLSHYASLAAAQSAQGGWAAISGFEEVGLADRTLDPVAFKNLYFNDVSFTAAGVQTDTVGGGLKKDLTAYLNSGAEIGDYASIPNSGIKGTSPLLNHDSLNNVSPTLGHVLSWWTQAGATADATAYAAPIVAPESLPKNYSIRHVRWNSNSPVIAPATATLGTPTYHNKTASAPFTPILTAFDFHYMPAFEPTGSSGTSYSLRFLFYPKITLWNPYSVKMQANGLRVAYLTYTQPRFNVAGRAWYSLRPIRRYKLLGKSGGDTLVLEPGQAITFVPKPGQDFAANYLTVPTHPDVEMIPANPSNTNYYVDRGTNISDNVGTNINVTLGTTTFNYGGGVFMEFADSPTGNSRCFIDNNAAYDEGINGGPLNQVFLTRGDVTLQQVNMDAWTMFNDVGFGYGNVAGYVSMAVVSSARDVTAQAVTGSAANGPDDGVHHGFRFMRLDDPTDTGGDPDTQRNTNFNPFVNFNFRATRFTRHPYDGAHRIRVPNQVGFGFLTSEVKLGLTDPAQWTPNAESASPFLSPDQAPASGRYALVDVPYKSLGLLSLGQLQHAPLLKMPWAPGFPVGNSFLPLRETDDSDANALDTRTGYSFAEEETIWNKVNATTQFKNYIRGMSGATMPWPTNLDSQRTLVDWSYELNHALWDSWMTSGIPKNNAGWTSTNWDFTTTGQEAVIPNSRYAPVSAIPTGGYFADRNFAAYRPAYTLLQQGQFNVNSTSVVAWQALLAAFRGIKAPTLDNTTNTERQTPYSRLTLPPTGPATSASNPYAKQTWGGFRALSDDEIRTLAVKIVAEVKSRGPFLSLGDFVNRRLKSAKSALEGSNWDGAETEFLGTLQAAINEAELNKNLSASSASDPLFMKRDANAKDTTGISAIARPQTKVKDKLTGAPGYLMQSDILQKIGPVLAARSDTFTIRALGSSEDGATAAVELVVQRTPEPVAPGLAADGALPVNPRAIRTGAHAGNQFFGRRFIVTATRWRDVADL